MCHVLTNAYCGLFVDESSPVPIADWSEEMNAEDSRQSGYYTDSILTGRGPRGGGGGYRPRGRGGRYPRGSGYSSNRSSGTVVNHDQQLQVSFHFLLIVVNKSLLFLAVEDITLYVNFCISFY